MLLSDLLAVTILGCFAISMGLWGVRSLLGPIDRLLERHHWVCDQLQEAHNQLPTVTVAAPPGPYLQQGKLNLHLPPEYIAVTPAVVAPKPEPTISTRRRLQLD